MANLDQLRPTQSTTVLTPDDAAYTDLSCAAGPPASPDVLVRPEVPEEVAAAVRWAAAEGVDVAVRGGGHGPWTPLPGGLMIDMVPSRRSP
jgi:FAD/FMN-containing dehydrogenase